jgi:hypothetical protein
VAQQDSSMVASDSSHHGGIGPLETFVERERPDGLVVRWESRRHRKHPDGATPEGSTLWAPRARGWWIAVLFAAGSVLFALGTIPGYADAVGSRADSLTFFVGSLFFTSAGYLCYREAVDAGSTGAGHRRFFVVQTRRIDWWATAIQLLGTLFFNLSTGNVLRADLAASVADHRVWRPDALGSVCFLLASALAWFEVCHGWTAWRPRSSSWWITGLNLAGSVAFGVSAVAAYIIPATGELRNAERANLGTFIGAVCFLAGALLLLPERTERPDPTGADVGAARTDAGGPDAGRPPP